VTTVIKLEETSTATRREFCVSCSKAAGLLALGAVTGCGGGSPTGPSSNAQSLASEGATVSGRTVSVAIGASSPLAATGGMAMTQTAIGSFLLTRTGASTVTVLTATCTHEGCTVSGFSGSQFVCPCHGSTFATSGSVVQGPANRALQQFPAQVSGDVVTFTG
jgi:cytochrome b6-f complex iron-sulfur subunit